MKKGDFIWGLTFITWFVILFIPSSRKIFFNITELHPYIAGFIKFAILATMGDLLGKRIVNKEWVIPQGMFMKSIIWGIIGMMITLVFTVYMGGVAAAQASGKLPFNGSVIAQALFGSVIMNVTFGPMMMFFHRFMDMYVDLRFQNKKVTIAVLVENNDWHSLVEFAWLKTCLLFWIPVHMLVFLLPSQYRVLVSAFLSIVLGLMLAIINMEKKAKKN